MLHHVSLPNDDIGLGSAVVLRHAGVADRTMWAEQSSVIADTGYRVIEMDLPGFGEATPRGELDPWSDVLICPRRPRSRYCCSGLAEHACDRSSQLLPTG